MSANPNMNCLEGMQCPKCGGFGPFEIAALLTVHVTDDGSEVPPQDHDWHDDSPARCLDAECEFTGRVSHFRISPLVEALVRIRDARDAIANGEEVEFGPDQCFDDWAADVASETLRKAGISA
jgi:hypothetical protein